MLFILSKTLSLLLEPLVFPYLFLAVGVIARWRRWRWIMRFSFTAAIALPLVFGNRILTAFKYSSKEC